MRKRRSIFLKLAAMVAGLSMAAQVHGAPSDVFQNAAPAVGGKVETTKGSHQSGATVDPASGTAQYSYSFTLPPGRLGVEPGLALTYNSRAPLRGGVAAGWTLPIPSIEIDTRTGTAKGLHYVSSLSGAARLTAVPEAVRPGYIAYRADFDNSYVRYQRNAGDGSWIAMTPDGRTYYFGDRPGSTDAAGADQPTEWMLTRTEDSFGNAISYEYEGVPFSGASGSGPVVDSRLMAIEYTSNANAGLPAHVRVELTYQLNPQVCAGTTLPIGAAVIGRAGRLLQRGSSRLDRVEVFVRPAPGEEFEDLPRRKYQLSYDSQADDCTRDHAPLRLLTSITESASLGGNTITLPPTTFEYGPLSFARTENRWLPAGVATVLAGGKRDFRTNPQFSDWPTVSDMMLDFDGDARLDLVHQGSHDYDWCNAYARRLDGTGGPAINLPTIPWGGGAQSGAEGCSLVGQLTELENKTFECENPDINVYNIGSYLGYRWIDLDGDGDQDIASQLQYDSLLYDPAADSGLAADTPYPSCPSEPCDTCTQVIYGPPDPYDTGCPEHYRLPETRCGGMHVWRVYWNDGPGLGVRSQAEIRYAPVPLEPSSGEGSSLGASWSYVHSSRAVIDIDGDGFVDAVKPLDASTLGVHFGDGTGSFAQQHTAWPQPGGVPLSDTCCPNASLAVSKVQGGLFDLNADGLPDLIGADPDGGGQMVWYNLGDRFAADGVSLASPLVLMDEGKTDIFAMEGSRISDGIRYTTKRLFDVDGDGLADLVNAPVWTTSSPTTFDPPTVHWNLGYPSLLAEVPTDPLFTEKISRPVIGTPDDVWQVAGDVIDINGDGFTDIVESTPDDANPTNLSYWSVPDDTPAPRLLRRVDAGTGHTIQFDYDVSTDRQVVTTGGMPGQLWVVTKTTEDFGFGSTVDAQLQPTTITTSYEYGDPQVNTDEYGARGFRGFRFMTSTGAAGAIAVSEFDYTLDPRGLPVGSTTYRDISDFIAQEPAQIARTTWTTGTLLAGATSTRLREHDYLWMCANGETHAQCLQGTPLDVKRRWLAVAPTSPAGTDQIVFAKDAEWRAEGDFEAGARQYLQTYHYKLWHDAENYRLVRWIDETKELKDGLFALVGKTMLNMEATGRVPVFVTEFVDSVNFARTRKLYDMTTGNVLKVWKPEQYANSGPASVFSYDSFELFAAAVTNELGHVIETEFDRGTGALLAQRGPNEINGVKEEQRQVIDALGRPTQRWVSVDDPVHGYRLEEVQRIWYNDTDLPRSVLTEDRKEYGGTVWVRNQQRIDGGGRALTATAYLASPTQPDAISAFVYDVTGGVAAFTAPDPSKNDASTVTYRYGYDSLGRPTQFRQPDGTGTKMSYDRLTHTVHECVAASTDLTVYCDESAPGTNLGVKRLTNDLFSRLVLVEEFIDIVDNAPAWAATTYGYDATDTLVAITDAEGLTTSLRHDWLSRRKAIERGKTVWQYEYDLNGNMVREVAPHASGSDPLLYTTSFAYDALDRPTSTLPAPLGMTIQQTAELGIGAIVRTYDGGPGGLSSVNNIGRLTTIQTPIVKDSFAYEARGGVVEHTRNFDLSSTDEPYADTRTISREFDALGNVVATSHADGSTQTSVSTDLRGRPRAAVWHYPTKDIRLGDVSFNVAGRIIRSTVPGGFSRNLTYDSLGRLHDDQAKTEGSERRGQISGPTTPFRQTFHYGPNDEVLTLKTSIGSNPKRAMQFDYDRRHQLTDAHDDFGYTGQFSYSAAGRLDTAYIGASPTAPEALPRDVKYEYDPDTHPEAVSRLFDATTSVTVAAYQHDQAGSVSRRTDAAGAYHFAYDGFRHQRKVVQPDLGSETYFYDGAGQRALSVRRNPAGQVTQVRQWFGSAEVWYHADATVEKTWVYDGLHAVARIENGTKLEFAHHGQLGHLIASTDTNGNIVAAYSYGPFGEILEAIGSTDDHLRRFNGKEHDAASGLRYYGARYYDPLSLSWTQADPLYRFVPDIALDEPREMNLYAFSLNNPVRYADLDGLQAKSGSTITFIMIDDGSKLTVDASEVTSNNWSFNAPEYEGYEYIETLSFVDKDGIPHNIPVFEKKGRTDGVEGEKSSVGGGQKVNYDVGQSQTGRGPIGVTHEQLQAASGWEKIAMILGGGALGYKMAQQAMKKAGGAIAKRGCFVAGTVVEAADGKKPIEEIRPGDLVLSRDQDSGHTRYLRVSQTFVRTEMEVYALSVASRNRVNETLETTAEHPFWVVDRGWVQVAEVAVGDRLLDSGGDEMTVTAVVATGAIATVYNIEVDGYQTYFVGQLGAWVHNKARMFGANGTQVTSKTVWRGKGKRAPRIDVENPNPGQRPGQIHFQEGDRKYLYDPATRSFPNAPGYVNEMLNRKEFRRGIGNAMKYLGEE